MTSRVARVVATLVAVAALGGCVKVTSTNSFSANDTVTQDTIVALEPAAAEQLGIDLDTLTADALLTSGSESLPGVDPAKVTIEDYVDGDLRGVHIIARDLTFDEFNAAATGALSASGAAGELTGGVGPSLSVERDGDNYVVTIPADDSRDLSEVQGGSSIGVLANSVEFSITLEFPGPVKSASAGEVDGKKVVLGLEDILTPEEIRVVGQATPGIAWGPILKWGGIAGLAVAIFGGAALLIWQDKRKRSRSSLPPPGEAPETEGA